MQREPRIRQLTAMLPANQQTLDFAKDKLWEQLPESAQQACRSALARLLYHVFESNHKEDDHE